MSSRNNNFFLCLKLIAYPCLSAKTELNTYPQYCLITEYARELKLKILDGYFNPFPHEVLNFWKIVFGCGENVRNERK